MDLAIGDEKQADLEKKTSEAKDNFTLATKSMEECEGTMGVKEAQLLKALDRHRSLEVQTMAEMRELPLI